jgi:hypothetical protein
MDDLVQNVAALESTLHSATSSISAQSCLCFGMETTTADIDISDPLIPSWIGTLSDIIAVTVSVTGIPGNALIVAVYSRKLQLNRVLILCLALVDLTTSCFIVPAYPFVLKISTPVIFKRIWAVVMVFLSTMSIWMLNCIAIECHRVICKPLTPQWTPPTATIIVLVGVVWGTALGLLRGFDINARYITLSVTGVYVMVSLLLMTTLYSRIAHAVIANRKIGPTEPSIVSKNKKRIGLFKSARMLAMTTLLFTLCFLPVHLSTFILKMNPDHVVFLTFPNYAINVIVYSAMNKNFRVDAVKAIRHLVATF